MAEILKVLGQTSATAAQASDILNLVKDPTFEAMTSSEAFLSTSNYSSWVKIPNTLWQFQHTQSSYPGSAFAGSTAQGSGYWSTFKSTTGQTLDSAFGSQALFFGWNVTTNNYGTFYATYGLGNGANGGSNSSSYFGGFNNSMPVSPSTTYYYGLSSTGYQYSGRNIRIIWFDANGNYISDNTGSNFNVGGSTWNRSSYNATSPSNAAYAGLEIYMELYMNTRAQFAIDGIYFGPSSTLSSTTPNPLLTTGNLLNAPFTERYNSTWAGTPNNSITIKNYAGASVDVYTVPSAKAAVVSSIVVANPTTSATTYRIAVVPSGETLALKHWNFFDIPLGANSSTAITLGLTLRAGDTIKVSSDTSNTQFSIYGSELDQA